MLQHLPKFLQILHMKLSIGILLRVKKSSAQSIPIRFPVGSPPISASLQSGIHPGNFAQQYVLALLKDMIVKHPLSAIRPGPALFTVLTEGNCIRQQGQQFPEGNMPPCEINRITEDPHGPDSGSGQKLLYVLSVDTRSITGAFRIGAGVLIVQKLLYNIFKKLFIAGQVAVFKITDVYILPLPGQFLHKIQGKLQDGLGEHPHIG